MDLIVPAGGPSYKPARLSQSRCSSLPKTRQMAYYLSGRCRDFQTQPSDSRDHPGFFGKIMQAFTFISTGLPQWRSRVNRRWPDRNDRPNGAKFPSAAQTALGLLDWTLRGSRAADRASCDALRLQRNLFNTEDHYEISIPREKLTASAPWRIPQAVRYARRSRGVESSRKKEHLAENHGLLRKRR